MEFFETSFLFVVRPFQAANDGSPESEFLFSARRLAPAGEPDGTRKPRNAASGL